MEFDLPINDESVERCFLVYDEIGFGFDIDSNGNYINFSGATVFKVTWYKDHDDCDVDDVVTVRVSEIYDSPFRNVTVEWIDESFKDDANARRLFTKAKLDLLNVPTCEKHGCDCWDYEDECDRCAFIVSQEEKEVEQIGKIHSLCQDCLRLNPVHPENEGICKCGGETCSCYTCSSAIQLLLYGCLDQHQLGLQSPINSWSPDTGWK